MAKRGGESPEMLLPDKENRSDRTEKATSMPSLNNDPMLQQHEHQHHGLTMFGFVSPIPQHSPVVASMIPLSPLLPLPPYSAAPGSNSSGIMPLTNFSFDNNPPPLRKLFDTRSPKIAPLNNLHSPPPPPPLMQLPRMQVPDYPYQERVIHHVGQVDSPRSPWMIPTLLIIHSLIFAITMYENDCPRTLHLNPPKKCVLRFLGRLSFQPLNENPLLGPSFKALLSIGALQSGLVTTAGQGWRLLTCVWLHAGVFHLFANMTGLLSIGIRLERDFGWLKVFTIYVMAGFGGSLLSALFLQNQISVGASGALMGLLGATVAEILVNWSVYNNRSRSLAALLLAIAVNLSFGLMPHVDNFTHIGGLSAGALLGSILLMRPRFAWLNEMSQALDEATRNRLKHTPVQSATWFLALALLLVCYGTAILTLFKGYGLQARRTCQWCRYMSCVPSFLWQCPAS